LVFASAFAAAGPAAQAAGLGGITIDYPRNESIFPLDFAPPTFIWRDPSEDARTWFIEMDFSDGGAPLRLKAESGLLRIGTIDPRCVAPSNELPRLTPEQEKTRTWVPDARTWETIKQRSSERPAKLTIEGYAGNGSREPLSRGTLSFRTSRDPVGAPVFYRDVPLMPSELEKGVIKPLAESATPLISWRLRYVNESRSRLMMEGIPTCANCHSFSLDGKTLGMDLDGPQNDKGLYTLSRVEPKMSIRNEDVISWNSFNDQPAGRMRVGFMSQVSPDGQYVVTTVTGRKEDLNRNYYVVNFKDYRFLQVFYATRGILAWYSRATGKRQALPGADDPRLVQTNAVWSPDGKYLVFARAAARDSYPEGRKMAEYANDPNETQIQYDLYRIPFNGGRGGRAEPVAGASQNGMSNAFPKVSPDGRWIVYVQCLNGLLMRPDSQLYIVPAEGGQPRRMRSNFPVMNSWHSFSPNGRWMVFSSKGESPYTRMYLTHIDENGEDSPAILIENATAANRAVNIPEFINVGRDGLDRIDVPAVEFYRRVNKAWELSGKGLRMEAISEWRRALELSPGDARANNNLGVELSRENKLDEALACWRKALDANEEYAEVHKNIGRVLLQREQHEEALRHWKRALELTPEDAKARVSLGVAYLRTGSNDDAAAEFQRALESVPGDIDAHYNLGVAMMRRERIDEAIAHYRKALEIDPKDAQSNNDLGVALLHKGRREEAVAHLRRAVEAKRGFTQAHGNLGGAYYLLGDCENAVAQWQRVLRAEPGNLQVLNQTAWVLATCVNGAVRNGGEAVKLASRAVEQSGGRQPQYLDTLAAAYAEAGRFPEAVDTARRALAIALGEKRQPLAESLRARISLYEAKTPMRDRRQ
jgi:tetratricopeptide (TPR) repeat protein